MSKKVFMTQPNEGWICDELHDLFVQGNQDICTDDPSSCDIFWQFCEWMHLPQTQAKTIIKTVHHLVPEKFSQPAVGHDRSSAERDRFFREDQQVTAYTVFNQNVYDQVRLLTSKPIHIMPYWYDDTFWRPLEGVSKTLLKEKYGIPTSRTIIISAIRDGEGSDPTKPKLEQGPDLFIQEVEGTCNPFVILTSWRRDYVKNELKKANIPFIHFEMCDRQMLRELYQLSDYCFDTCRFAGGPFQLIEAKAMGINTHSLQQGIGDRFDINCFKRANSFPVWRKLFNEIAGGLKK